MKTHNDITIDINFTSLMGYVDTTYDMLVKTFGEPTEGDGFKIDAEWQIQFADGVIATVYNWKNGRNYCGDAGIDVRDITHWHVGGHTVHAVTRVMRALGVLTTDPQETEEAA